MSYEMDFPSHKWNFCWDIPSSEETPFSLQTPTQTFLNVFRPSLISVLHERVKNKQN